MCGWCGKKATRVQLVGHEEVRRAALNCWSSWDACLTLTEYYLEDVRVLKRHAKMAAELKEGQEIGGTGA